MKEHFFRFALVVMAMCAELGCSRKAVDLPEAKQQVSEAESSSDLQAKVESMLVVDKSTFEQPVTAAAVCTRRQTGTGQVDVWIKLQIASGHYIYAPRKASDAKSPLVGLSIDVQIADGSTVDCQWEYPAATENDGHSIYMGTILIHGNCTTADNSIEPELVVAVKYQACNPDVCLPPSSLKLTSPVVKF